MEFSYEIKNSVGDLWNNTLIKNKSATIFQTKNWAKIYEKTYGSKPFFIYVYDNSNEIVGQLLCISHYQYYWNKQNFLNRLNQKIDFGNMLSWKYGPVIHNENNLEQILSEIIKAINEIIKKNRVVLVKGTEPPSSKSLLKNFFKKNEYEIKSWATYVLKLKPNLIDLDQLDKSTRYDIRKAEQNKLEFEVLNQENSSEIFSKLKSDVLYNDPNFHTEYDLDFFESHKKFLLKENMEKIFVAKKDGKPIAALRNMIFNNYAIQHSIATPSSFKNLQTGSFITWNAIKWSLDNDLKYYDMGGVNPNPISNKEKGIDFYKSKWGGEKIVYSTFIKISDNLRYKISKLLSDPNVLQRRLRKIFPS